jgi:hypothetical protein
MTALAMACQGGHFALAEFLIKKKVRGINEST